MNARSLLQALKSHLECDAYFRNRSVMTIKENGDMFEATVSFPVEGQVRVIRLMAVDLGLYDEFPKSIDRRAS